MTLRSLIELFLNGLDDKIYIDVFDCNESVEIFHDIRIISSDLYPYYDREVIALTDSCDNLLSVILGKEKKEK